MNKNIKDFHMNKICISIVAIGFSLISPAHAALYNINGTFTQYASDGSVSYYGNIDGISGTYNDVTGSINMNLDNLWALYNISVVGDVITTPGSYSWEACLPDGSANCTAPDPITANIGTGQWGMHALYNWGTSTSIDLVNV